MKKTVSKNIKLNNDDLKVIDTVKAGAKKVSCDRNLSAKK
jgi:hypothetical protein